jgi:hypothetical protein
VIANYSSYGVIANYSSYGVIANYSSCGVFFSLGLLTIVPVVFFSP